MKLEMIDTATLRNIPVAEGFIVSIGLQIIPCAFDWKKNRSLTFLAQRYKSC